MNYVRQSEDLKILSLMRRTSGYCEANSEYGYSRLTMELKEEALDVGERRVG